MSIERYSVRKLDRDSIEEIEDILTVEAALQIVINQQPFTMTMRTPGNDLSLIRGLLHTEEVLKNSNYLPDIELKKQNCLLTLAELNIPTEEQGPGMNAKRSLLSVSSCGICGKTELDNLGTDGEIESEDIIDNYFLQRIFKSMSEKQKYFKESGGTHAAAAFSANGEMLCLMEDIGRHNAVDKVVGELILKGQLKNKIDQKNKNEQVTCLTVSGRISYEIVMKCYRAGIPFLAAVSAPSSLAVDYAKELGITLFAFCRGHVATCYSHPERTRSGMLIDTQ